MEESRELKEAAVISFTQRGAVLSQKITEVLLAWGYRVNLATKCRQLDKADCTILYETDSLSKWAQKRFERHEAIIFVGAVGIAVRAIAPYLKDKLSDPPVLVMDELGQYVIPILSGHVGGANELAVFMARQLGAQAVLTTATDLNHLFAVDLFAKKNQLVLSDRNGIAKVSSKVLRREPVFFACDGIIENEIPAELVRKIGTKREICLDDMGQKMLDFVISPYIIDNRCSLQLFPKCIVVGVGCKRGKQKAEIEAVVQTVLRQYGISKNAVCEITSIDVKKDEEGIVALAEQYQVPYQVFSAEALLEVKGTFSSSDFVRKQVGVDNVCTRSAMAACCGKGKLIADKFACEGVTVALAEKEWSVRF
ncbi:MAG: cobalt-precorrin 5A hydrolase [Lachnospiraceae bacterium]